jgi:hypothetical protein
LVEAISGDEGSHPFIALPDAYVVKGGNDVQLGKDLCLAQTVKRLFDQWYRVTILDSDRIKCSIIHADSKASVRLPNDEDW